MCRWSDDAAARDLGLRLFARAFHRRQGRSPTLFVDRWCVDQSDVGGSLASLPVWLASCRGLLIVAGPAYTRRLWCLLELFTFLAAGGTGRNVVVVVVDGDQDTWVRQVADLDVSAAACADEDDRAALHAILRSFPGGIDGFSGAARALLTSARTVVLGPELVPMSQ